MQELVWPVGTLALFTAIASRWIHRGMPHMIVGMVAAGALAAWLGSVPTVGELPAALPRLSVPSFKKAVWSQLAVSAAIIAVLGCERRAETACFLPV